MTTNQFSGAENLLTPDNHALLLIDHQYLQLMALTSHKPATVASNATALAKAAKVFNVPTLLTTAFAERQAVLKEIQAVYPDQKPIDRTGQPRREPRDVKPQFARTQIDVLLLHGHQVQQQGGPPKLLQYARHSSIPWTVAATATAVGEKYNATDLIRRHIQDGKITVQQHAVGEHPNRPLKHAVVPHPGSPRRLRRTMTAMSTAPAAASITSTTTKPIGTSIT